MSDGARCHYCRRVPCECAEMPDPRDARIAELERDREQLCTTIAELQSGYAQVEARAVAAERKRDELQADLDWLDLDWLELAERNGTWIPRLDPVSANPNADFAWRATPHGTEMFDTLRAAIRAARKA